MSFVLFQVSRHLRSLRGALLIVVDAQLTAFRNYENHKGRGSFPLYLKYVTQRSLVYLPLRSIHKAVKIT